MRKNCFVFVVCGAKEHIDTLHFSLPYLKRFSKNDILVLTDSSRNEMPIQYENVIDVKTPEEFDNHQASIYLKTGIHKFVPSGVSYCYLDTDILAFNSHVDLIFDEFIAPIRFAPDHCKVDKFSAYAVNCGCQEKWEVDREKFLKAIFKYDKNRTITDKRLKESAKELDKVFLTLKGDKKMKLYTACRYLFSFPTFRLNDEFTFNRMKRVWLNSDQEVVMHEVKTRKIEKETGLKYNRFNQTWYNSDKKGIWADECQHLKEIISNKFGVHVRDPKFQHWNGGVFLFNDSSHEFLESWFSKTMEIFKDPNWKTRDQGTLIATVWEFGLQSHPTLDKKWNLIADYNNPFLKWISETEVQLATKEIIKPNFVHVYHHFGDENWSFWNLLILNLET